MHEARRPYVRLSLYVWSVQCLREEDAHGEHLILLRLFLPIEVGSA